MTMKKYLFLLLVLFLVPALTASAGKIVTDSLRSEILNSTVKFNVYLPDGFDKSDATYPVIYLLHGLTGNHTDWKNLGHMQTVADELSRSGEIRPMVIVMPCAGDRDTHHVPNGYFNMPNWNYEDFFYQEFIPAVETKYRIVGDKGHRAVQGLSMGGGGSAVYAQRYPGMYSSCYIMSGWLDNKADEVKASKGPKDCLYYTGEAVREHSAIDFVNNADEATIEALKTVKWFIDCGDDDFLFDQNVSLHQAMRRHGIKSELRVRDGVHNWEYWHLALRMSLPFASRNFDK